MHDRVAVYLMGNIEPQIFIAYPLPIFSGVLLDEIKVVPSIGNPPDDLGPDEFRAGGLSLGEPSREASAEAFAEAFAEPMEHGCTPSKLKITITTLGNARYAAEIESSPQFSRVAVLNGDRNPGVYG